MSRAEDALYEILGWMITWLMMPFCIVGMAGLVVFGAVEGWHALFGKKDPWRCDAQVAAGTYTTPVLVGKVIMSTTHTRYRCVLWSQPTDDGVLLSDGHKQVLVTPALDVMR